MPVSVWKPEEAIRLPCAELEVWVGCELVIWALGSKLQLPQWCDRCHLWPIFPEQQHRANHYCFREKRLLFPF